MTKRTTKETAKRPAMGRDGFRQLSPSEIEALWRRWRATGSELDYDYIEAALSGDDPAAASAYISWIFSNLRNEKSIDGDEREFLLRGLGRYLGRALENPKLTLGQALGIERAPGKRAPAVRSGLVHHVNQIIDFLHKAEGYPLTLNATGNQTAFDVAAQMLAARKFVRSPDTLQTEYWPKRKRDK